MGFLLGANLFSVISLLLPANDGNWLDWIWQVFYYLDESTVRRQCTDDLRRQFIYLSNGQRCRVIFSMVYAQHEKLSSYWMFWEFREFYLFGICIDIENETQHLSILLIKITYSWTKNRKNVLNSESELFFQFSLTITMFSKFGSLISITSNI